MNDEQAEQMVRALVGIGAELTAIRQQLQAMNDRTPDPSPDVESFTCRCGQTVVGSEAARRHAVDAHSAPPDHWEELYDVGDE